MELLLENGADVNIAEEVMSLVLMCTSPVLEVVVG